MRFILVLLLLISMNGFGQKWKNYIISVKGDTLNRVDMEGKKQGPWVIHVEELRGEPGFDEQGYFTDDKKDGLWVRFSLIGDKIAEENFRWGSLDGRSRYYNRTGGLEREESWRAVDPSKDMDTVDVYDINDPTKVVDQVVIKVTGQTNKHGVWTYYDPMWGTIQRTERYFLNKLQTGNEGGEGDDGEIRPLGVSNGKTKTDSTGKKIVSKPQPMLDYEKKNSGKKKIKTRDGSTGGY
jgi:antitoxin component YwqK of YwqJK toxin-antitoxin module